MNSPFVIPNPYLKDTEPEQVITLKEFKAKELTGIWKLIRETIINRGSIDGDITCMLEDIDNITKTNYSKAIQSLIYDSNIPESTAMKCMFIHAMTLVKFDDNTITNTFKSIDEVVFGERYTTPKKVAEIIAAHINKPKPKLSRLLTSNELIKSLESKYGVTISPRSVDDIIDMVIKLKQDKILRPEDHDRFVITALQELYNTIIDSRNTK